VIFEHGKIFISQHTLHRVETRSIEQSLTPSPPFFNLFVISETFATKVGFSGLNRWKSLVAKSGLYGVWHCHDEAVPLFPLAWTFSANCILKLQQNFTVRCRIHIFTTLLKMG
jgi:hypothetical protein